MKLVESIALILLVALVAYRWLTGSPTQQLSSDSLLAGSSATLPASLSRPILEYGPPAVSSDRGIDTLMIVTDFQCPFCRRLHHALDSVARSDRFVVKIFHLPLIEIHPLAFEAAVAFECASKQNAQQRIHDVLFDSMSLVRESRWETLASAAGVADTIAFYKCRRAGEVTAFVRGDREAILREGITSTPTLVHQGRRLIGRPSADAIRSLINDSKR